MKYLLSIVFFISSTPFLFGQQFVIDSLAQLLKTEENPIRKADLHLGLSRAYSFVNNEAEQIKEHIEIALKLSQKYDYLEGEAIALILEATRKSSQEGIAKATYENALKAIEIAQSIRSKSLETFAQYKLAEYYISDESDNHTGINILKKTIQQLDETVPDIHIGNCYKILGLAYENQGQNSLSIQAFEKALSFFNQVKKQAFINPNLGRPSAMEADRGIMNTAQVYWNLGSIYKMLGAKDKAIDYLVRAKDIFEDGEAYLSSAMTLEELGFKGI